MLLKLSKEKPYTGIGKPEPLKFDLAGYWSRRIDLAHRTIYKIENGELIIFCMQIIIMIDERFWIKS